MARDWLLFIVALAIGWVAGYVQARRAAPPSSVRLPEPGEMPDVEDLVAQRRKVPAIKAYRRRTGAGLAEAKAVIDGLAARLKKT